MLRRTGPRWLLSKFRRQPIQGPCAAVEAALKSIRLVRTVLALTAGLALFAGSAAAAPPNEMQLQGYLESSGGTPVTGQFNLTIRIFTTQVNGTASWSTTLGNVTVTNGIYEVTLPSLNPTLFKDQGSLWLETQVNAEPPLPRRKMTPSAWAFHSVTADTAAVANDLQCTPTWRRGSPSGGT